MIKQDCRNKLLSEIILNVYKVDHFSSVSDLRQIPRTRDREDRSTEWRSNILLEIHIKCNYTPANFSLCWGNKEMYELPWSP